MKRYIAFGAIAIVLIAGVVHFSRTMASPPIDPRLIDADNDFAFRLYKEIAKKDGDKNIFISPVSIALALQMTYNGASGTVKEEMAQTLGVQEMALADLNLANARLFSTLEDPHKGVQLNIANSIWTDKKLSADYKDGVGLAYHAKFGPLKLDAINAWVNQQTKGKINKMIDHLDPSLIVMLVSAIYFKGDWESKFDKRWTDDMQFHVGGGKEKDVPTMYQKSRFASMDDAGVSAIRLPYAKERLSMYVFLPNSLPKFLADLDAKDWDRWMSKFGPKEDVDLYLPKFSLEYGKDLKEQLRAMGMVEAFDGEDFEAMLGGGGSWIGEVDHKAVIEVNEKGTEAAAATSVGVFAGGDLFMVNRPFFFVIRDDKTGLILFMGSVVDPTEH